MCLSLSSESDSVEKNVCLLDGGKMKLRKRICLPRFRESEVEEEHLSFSTGEK